MSCSWLVDWSKHKLPTIFVFELYIVKLWLKHYAVWFWSHFELKSWFIYCFMSIDSNVFVFTGQSWASGLNFSTTAAMVLQWLDAKLCKILAAEAAGLVGPPRKGLWCHSYMISGAKTLQNLVSNIYIHPCKFSAKLEMVERGPLVHLKWNDPITERNLNML